LERKQSPQAVRRSRDRHRLGTEVNIKWKIWGFHGGEYEEWCLLGCYAVRLL
jgi:hypothetical protein